MKGPHLLGAVYVILFSLVAGAANAAFIGRLETSAGSGIFNAYYDDQLDITWVEAIENYGFPVISV